MIVHTLRTSLQINCFWLFMFFWQNHKNAEDDCAFSNLLYFWMQHVIKELGSNDSIKNQYMSISKPKFDLVYDWFHQYLSNLN